MENIVNTLFRIGTNMKENNEQEYRFVFWELLLAIRDKAMLIIVCTIIGGLAGWGIAKAIIVPKYEASVNMIVNMKADIEGYMSSDSISSAQTLAETYAIIIKSNTVLKQVVENLDLEISYEELNEQVTVNAINETQVMKISVESDNPTTALKTVEEISVVAPDIVVEAVEAGSCKVVSLPEVKEGSSTADIIKSASVCAFLTLVICLSIIVLKELRNDYIVDELDIENKLGILTLGIIPNVGEK